MCPYQLCISAKDLDHRKIKKVKFRLRLKMPHRNFSTVFQLGEVCGVYVTIL